MAKYFNQSDIDEFSDCVGLFAKEAKAKIISSPEELTLIMRSLGFSPSIEEIDKYYKQYEKEGKIDFATFLDIMHDHSRIERCQQEVLAAFQAHDKHGRGTVPGAELYHILTKFGEKLGKEEVDRLFKEAGINPRGEVPYEGIVQTLLTPIPDYGGI